jgi:hypothetical protein
MTPPRIQLPLKSSHEHEVLICRMYYLSISLSKDFSTMVKRQGHVSSAVDKHWASLLAPEKIFPAIAAYLAFNSPTAASN